MIYKLLTCKHHWKLKSLDIAGLGFIVELEVLFAAVLFKNAKLSVRVVNTQVGFLVFLLNNRPIYEKRLVIVFEMEICLHHKSSFKLALWIG